MQDNYVRNWFLCENTISEVPIPANTPGLSSTTDVHHYLMFLILPLMFLSSSDLSLQIMKKILQLPDDFLSCLGVALSPANLAVALV